METEAVRPVDISPHAFIDSVFETSARQMKVLLMLVQTGLSGLDLNTLLSPMPGDIMERALGDAISGIAASSRMGGRFLERNPGEAHRLIRSIPARASENDELITSLQVRTCVATSLMALASLETLAEKRRFSYMHLRGRMSKPDLGELELWESRWFHNNNDTLEQVKVLQRLQQTAISLHVGEQVERTTVVELGHFFAAHLTVDN